MRASVRRHIRRISSGKTDVRQHFRKLSGDQRGIDAARKDYNTKLADTGAGAYSVKKIDDEYMTEPIPNFGEKPDHSFDKTLTSLDTTFESSSGTTPQFAGYARNFKREFKKSLEAEGYSNLDFHRGHFETSGFFTDNKTGKIWYFSQSDVRFFPDKQLLIRSAKGYKDYTGGMNKYVALDKNLISSIKRVTRGQP